MKLQQAIAKAIQKICQKHHGNVLGQIFPFLFGQKGAPRDVEGTKYDFKEHQECQEIYKKCWGNYG